MRTSAAAGTRVLSGVCRDARVRRRPVRREASLRLERPGENYHVEIGGFLWFPTPDIAITSESLGIIGSKIDFVTDLGIETSTFKQLRVVAAAQHQAQVPLRVHADHATQRASTLKRDLIFNGISYPISLPVATELKWKAYRFGYEYDFVYRDRGFAGLLLEAKYTDVQATLSNVLDTEFVHARAPIPAVGFIGRGYVAPNISITGEFSFFPLPQDISEDYKAKYYDFDLYGTVNFTDNFGAQGGYRSFDVFYHIKKDEGDLRSRASTSAESYGSDEAVVLRLPTIYSSLTNAPRKRVSRLVGSASFGLNPDVDLKRHESGAAGRVDRDVDAPLLARREPQRLTPRAAPGDDHVVDGRVAHLKQQSTTAVRRAAAPPTSHAHHRARSRRAPESSARP